MTIAQRPVDELAEGNGEPPEGPGPPANDGREEARSRRTSRSSARLGRRRTARMLLRALYFAVAAARADDLVLDEPLQCVPVEGEPAGAGGGLRGARHRRRARRSASCSARRHGIRPMLIYLATTRRTPPTGSTRIRPRADGAAHAGVDRRYTQRDVQELARRPTGFSASRPRNAKVHPGTPRLWRQAAAGRTIRGACKPSGRGTRSAGAAPRQARFICRKLALFLVSDDLSEALVSGSRRPSARAMATSPAVLPSFSLLPGQSLSRNEIQGSRALRRVGVRLAYDDKAILNAAR